MQYSQLQRAMVSGARIFQLLDVEPGVVERPDAERLPRARGEVRFEGVGFRYSADTPVLEAIDLQVKAGETVALVGPTGAGKTTLAALLMCLYEVSEGRITVDGRDIREVSLDSLSRQMSVVPQEPFLFSGTVEENIRYNRTEADHSSGISSAIFLVLLTNSGSSRLSNCSSVSRTRGRLSCIVPELSVSLRALPYPFR